MRRSQLEAKFNRWPGILARDCSGENHAVIWPLQANSITCRGWILRHFCAGCLYNCGKYNNHQAIAAPNIIYGIIWPYAPHKPTMLSYSCLYTQHTWCKSTRLEPCSCPSGKSSGILCPFISILVFTAAKCWTTDCDHFIRYTQVNPTTEHLKWHNAKKCLKWSMAAPIWVRFGWKYSWTMQELQTFLFINLQHLVVHENLDSWLLSCSVARCMIAKQTARERNSKPLHVAKSTIWHILGKEKRARERDH